MDDTNIDKIEPLANVALRHRVVQRLLAALVAGKLSAGTRLVAKRLAERLGVSATPIREALVELEQMDHDALLAGDASAAAAAQHIDGVGRCLEQTLFDHQPPEK
jgi:DNA-binding GntR family transcriptional regulator